MAGPGGSKLLNFSGLEEVVNQLEALGVDTTQAAARAIYSTAQHIANQSQNLVPVDPVVLRGTMDVTRMKSFTQKDIRSVISYGGPSAPYAVEQHENLKLWHPPKPPGRSVVGKRQGSGPKEPGERGGPKYLEHPFLEETKNWPARLAERIVAESKWLKG